MRINGSMEKTSIQDHVALLEFFDPASNSGYSVDTMLFESRELLEVPRGDLISSLAQMEAEGLIAQEENYYRSTIKGQIYKRRLLAKKGMLTSALNNQREHPLESLILAVVANEQCDVLSFGDVVDVSALSVYLHEYDEAEVCSTLQALGQRGLLETSEIWLHPSLTITAEGLRHYQLIVREGLGLGCDEGILRVSEPVDYDPRFKNLKIDPPMAENLQVRWAEMEMCAANKCYLASIVLLGSILEGLLSALLQQNIASAMISSKAPVNGRTKQKKLISEWQLHEYISVSADIGLVPKSVEKHVHELRDTRNFVHPSKQLDSNIVADEPLYRISREVAETIIDALSS